jgi:nucleotide-binding universal stress UspA family protein
MSKPILAGYDPEKRDRTPVRFAVAATRFTDAPLIIACVCGAGADHHSGERLIETATPQLDEIRGELEAEGVSAEYRELHGHSAARALHESAESDHVGLLVVGSAADGVAGRVGPGSTGARLLHGAPCPIAVVPHGWQPRGEVDTIGVAYVDTGEGRDALRGAHALAVRAGARLRVLTVHTPGGERYRETEARMNIQPGKSAVDVEGEYRIAVEGEVRTAVSELGDAVPIDVDVFVEDDTAATLVRVSENLDLLVCGSRGYGPLRAVLLGGVSRRVVDAAHCPVIVLPRGVRAPLDELMAERADAPA